MVMSNKEKILWTLQAKEDLREIKVFIDRDAPFTAVAFVASSEISGSSTGLARIGWRS